MDSYPKMKILSIFTHPQVVQNTHDLHHLWKWVGIQTNWNPLTSIVWKKKKSWNDMRDPTLLT